MELVIFGLTITSSWGNGHATIWPGLLASLAELGHDITFFERNVPYYAAHRDLHRSSQCRIALYDGWSEVTELARTEVDGAGAAIVTERMVLAGVTRICCVIGPGNTDIMNNGVTFGGGAPICYVVQTRPNGLCDAVFTALPFVAPEDDVLIGLPDTVWFPEDGLRHLPAAKFSFLPFPVSRPGFIDAVVTDQNDHVREIQVKQQNASFIVDLGRIPHAWSRACATARAMRERNERDQYISTLLNEYIARGGEAVALRAGKEYVDVGTLQGYRGAVTLLGAQGSAEGRTAPVPHVAR